jgi:uncharacterized repeat protein (TIGR03809 family)
MRWRSLAERRRAHFVELYKSGWWNRYYTEEAFQAHMRELVRGVEAWTSVISPGATKPTSSSGTDRKS